LNVKNIEKKMIRHINTLLNEGSLPDLPDELKEIEGFSDIDQDIRSLRQNINSIGTGNLSEKISGTGYFFGIIKNLQATLRNFMWQTKAISMGNFNYKVEFLGEFSEAFNVMAKKLETTINEVKDAQALFELIFKTIPDATVIMAYDNLELFDCNHAFTSIFKCSKSYLYGKYVNDMLFPDDKLAEEQFKKSFECPQSSQNLSLKLSLINGFSFYALFSSAIIHIMDKKYVLTVIKDITEMKRMEMEIKRLMQIDPLTQLYNRFKIDDALISEAQRTKGDDAVFSIIIFDIDDFKSINDNHGHIVGDEILKSISQIVKDNIRSSDIAGRWGGEEFIIILQNTNSEKGFVLAEQLRLEIEKHNFTQVGKVTASFGIAQSDATVDSTAIVSNADKAMYEAKKSGKNKTIVYNGGALS